VISHLQTDVLSSIFRAMMDSGGVVRDDARNIQKILPRDVGHLDHVD
jgi:hypothetical protein